MTWDSGSAYEVFMGRWSRRIASRFVSNLDLGPGLRWLDVGCGTGALTSTIVDLAAPASVVGVDASRSFIDEAVARIGAGASFRVANGDALPFPDTSFDVVVSGLALNFMPDPELALAEWLRVLQRPGQVAVYVWDYANGMEFLRSFWDAVGALDPGGLENSQAERFPICQPDALRSAFGAVGLHAAEVGAIEIQTAFTDFDDYWRPFLSGIGPAGAYVAGLDRGMREQLAESLRGSLEQRPDGSIHLSARAWTATGST